jgi:hypothetical protein
MEQETTVTTTIQDMLSSIMPMLHMLLLFRIAKIILFLKFITLMTKKLNKASGIHLLGQLHQLLDQLNLL